MSGHETGSRFVAPDDRAEVAIIIVTYNNAEHVASLLESLRAEAADVRIRLVIADNGSADDTVALLSAEPDVIVVETGGNLGYAGGVNVACSRLGAADTVLVLNPDLAIEPGTLRIMLDRMAASGAGVVVPRLVGTGGTTSHSLRREPTITSSIGDALFGRHLPGRPASLSEIDLDVASYEHAHPVEWATGAAVLTRRDVANAVGDWDERFFLYSEEIDYFRRARETGASVWYEPAARMRHDEGGSGTSRELAALMAVNRVRYIRKYHSAGYAAAFHATVILHEALRSYRGAHRFTLRTMLDQASWRRLPRATRAPR